MIARLKNLYAAHREIIVYVIFGVLTTLVNWLTYALCNGLLRIEQTTANAIAWTAGVIFAFFVNKIWVFRSRASGAAALREAASFVGARALSGVIEIFLPTLLVRWGLSQTLFGVDGLLAKLLTSVIVIVLNFVFSKFFVFIGTGGRAAGKTARAVYAVLCILAVAFSLWWLWR